jgi:hypothetical protein
MPPSRERLARNQAIFREVNERLRSMADAVPDGQADYVCECSDVECTAKIELKPAEYEAVRARENTFFIVPGHERLEVERLVDQIDGYLIVEKTVPVDEAAGHEL